MLPGGTRWLDLYAGTGVLLSLMFLHARHIQPLIKLHKPATCVCHQWEWQEQVQYASCGQAE